MLNLFLKEFMHEIKFKLLKTGPTGVERPLQDTASIYPAHRKSRDSESKRA